MSILILYGSQIDLLNVEFLFDHSIPTTVASVHALTTNRQLWAFNPYRMKKVARLYKYSFLFETT